MAKTSVKTVPRKPNPKVSKKKPQSKATPEKEGKVYAFNFEGFEPEVVKLLRTSSDVAPRADESVGEYKQSCEVFRNLHIEQGDICFVEFSASEVTSSETVISIETTYMVVITAPVTATRAQRDAFTEFYVKNIVWQRFRDFCDFTLAQGAESLSLPLSLTGEVSFKTFGE
jgi:hypothetical protein